MASTAKKIIAVLGATGKQGGGFIDYALKDGTFALRGITRNKDSPSAQGLAKKGVEVAVADLEDVESLKKAFEGAYGVFGVTDYWTAFNKETQHGKNLVDAAKATGVKHFVWSTLDRSKITHYNTKADIDDYLKASGVPRTSLYTCFFFDNFLGSIIKKDPNVEGGILLSTDTALDEKIPAFYSRDLGAWVLVAFKNPDEWIGKDMDVVTEIITYRQVAESVSKILGAPLRIEQEVTLKEYLAQKKEGFAEELWENLKFYYENPNLRGDPAASRAIVEKALGVNVRRLDDLLKEWGWKVVQ